MLSVFVLLYLKRNDGNKEKGENGLCIHDGFYLGLPGKYNNKKITMC